MMPHDCRKRLRRYVSRLTSRCDESDASSHETDRGGKERCLKCGRFTFYSFAFYARAFVSVVVTSRCLHAESKREMIIAFLPVCSK